MKIKDTIRKIISDIQTRKAPISSKEKHALAVDMIKLYDMSQNMYDTAKWIQGAVLYKIHQYNLYKYLDGGTNAPNVKVSQKEFFEGQNIAPSTARIRIEMWRFYIIKHNIDMELLAEADPHKLFKVIKVLETKDKKTVIEAVKNAKKKLLSRSDYYKLYKL